MTDVATLSNVLAWSVQVGLLTAAAAVMASLLHIDAPAVRYAWWRIVLVLCLSLPLVQPWQPAVVLPFEQAPAEFAPPVADTGIPSAGPSSPSRSLLPAAALRHWPALVGAALVAGALARLAWMAAGLVRLRRLRRAGDRAAACEAHDELQALIEAGAEIRYVATLGQPVTFGLLRPVVLLPRKLESMPPAVQRAVLAHELWHVRRRDWVWGLGEECVRAVLWFHPAIWYLVSRVQAAREEVVDELSILLTNARRSYLEALLAFADEPTLFPAAPFARRRRLFNRMLLVSKEAVMSSRRIIASSAAMAGALLMAAWYASAAFPLIATSDSGGTLGVAALSNQAVDSLEGQPPRDPRPGQPRPPTSQEAELRSAAEADPSNVQNWLQLGKLQEQRNALEEAEASFTAALRAAHDTPAAKEVLAAVTRFFQRTGQFDKAVAMLEDAAARDPSNPTGHQLVATFYWEKAYKDTSLTPTEKLTYIQAGIDATDRALTYKPDYVEALTYKNILLRMQANLETDQGRRQQLIAEADALRNRAIELNKASGKAGPGDAQGSPRPPVEQYEVDGQAPVRVGGNVKPPLKIRDVRPVYPAEARDEGVQGVVIIEAVLDTSGGVREAKVLRSIPLLDQAALDAVHQWQFTPTLLNGVAVPVIMTVTVNFTLQ
ncbi:MAG TPA: TonB family protein [Vicinamibacterales bacterium]|nr:TonB family protein [Vicinamibacterales bacterium]